MIRPRIYLGTYKSFKRLERDQRYRNTSCYRDCPEERKESFFRDNSSKNKANELITKICISVL